MLKLLFYNKVIDYPDGSRYTLHSDDTKILTNPNGEIIIEHPDYVSVNMNPKV